MPTINAGSSATLTLYPGDSVALASTQNGSGTVTVTEDGLANSYPGVSVTPQVFNFGPPAMSRTIGPYPLNAAVTIACAGGSVDYAQTVVAPLTDIYLMPAPTGGDDAALFTAALASGKGEWQLRRGTYLIGTAVTGITEVTVRGRGRDRTTIKMKDSALLAACFVGAASATNVAFKDLTYDGNKANNASGLGQLMDVATNTTVGFVVTGCRVKNTRGSAGAFNISNCTDFLIDSNIFQDADSAALRTGSGGANGSITNNYFTAWWASGVPSAAAAIWILGDATNKNIVIANNRFLRTGPANTFCIESVPTGTVYNPGFTIANNVMDGGGSRGTGISGFFSDTTIVGNVMVNGGDDAGAWSGQRNGIESFGTRCVISGNFIENGAIVLAKGASYSAGSGHIVNGNIIKIAQATSTGIQPLSLKDQDDFVVSGNRITVTLSGSATAASYLYAGFYGGSGALNRGQIYGNMISNVGTAAGNGMRLLASASTDLDVHDNVVDNCINGILNQANANDANLRLRNNTLWNNTTPMNGASTGTGYVDRGNIKVTGQLQLNHDGAQTFTPAGAGTVTPDCRLGLHCNVTMPAGNITIAAPTNAVSGMAIFFDILQDATGSRTITWNATFKKAADGAGGANTRGCAAFRYNGTNWVQFGGALAFF